MSAGTALAARKLRSPAALREALRSRLAALTGAIVLAVVAIVFARCGEVAQDLFRHVDSDHPLLALLLPPGLFMSVVWLTRTSAPLARGSGIPQVMAAAEHLHSPTAEKSLSLGTATMKFVGTLAVLVGGGSAGREGPSVQISAAIMRAVHRLFGARVTSGIVIAGGAAGVAAAFNTPLAGIAFAVEELASAFEQKVAMTVMAAVMVSGLVSLSLAGDYVYFGAMNAQINGPAMLLAAPLAGVIGGLMGGIFARVLVMFAWSRANWLTPVRAHPVLFAGLCGVIVAVTGYLSGGLSWGTGYGTTKALLTGQTAPLAFAPAKLIATTATALSGAPGGIFAPSLSVGAGLGQWMALAVQAIFPGVPSGAIILLGIAGYFTGVTRAPLTAVIIVMEMSADRGMILPLMATALVADTVSTMVCRRKLYHAQSLQFR
ncbi:chloride channel protein [Novosphingobium nitrogenifigens]|uniref:chloride channel protein n=1 Tax=Novosphingobium nitrogenifigens TaxID=378548 RepID=UPI0002E7D800|nr:chloride channel protein [Novosphingobium nitrogenifigens]